MPREAEKIDFEIIHHLPNQLGECPVWDDRENLLYWVDIKARQILRHDPSSEKTDSVDVPGRPGMLALCEDDASSNLLIDLQLFGDLPLSVLGFRIACCNNKSFIGDKIIY